MLLFQHSSNETFKTERKVFSMATEHETSCMNMKYKLSLTIYLENTLRLFGLLTHEEFHRGTKPHIISKGHITQEHNFIENTKNCIWNHN